MTERKGLASMKYCGCTEGGIPRSILYAAGSLVCVLAMAGCQSMPPLGEQERLVQNKQLTVQQISPKAVVNVWGKPVYHHSEFTQFFVMPDKSMIPRSRVPIGEAPE